MIPLKGKHLVIILISLFLLAMGPSPAFAPGTRSTTTTVTCSPSTVTYNTATICNAQVVDTQGAGAITPLGSVSFTSSNSGSFAGATPTCELANSGTVGTAVCRVPEGYIPSVVGRHDITGIYTPNATDTVHIGSTSPAFTVTAIGKGQVCIVDPAVDSTVTSANACPVGSSGLAGPRQGEIPTGGTTQLRVSINVNNTSSLNGFDITLIADHTKLQPFGVDLSSSVVPSANIGNECVGGIPKSGSCPNQALNNPDTLQLGVSGTPTPNPAFGNLFTAIYNIVGDTTGTSIGFKTGCGTLTSLPPLCVTLTGGGSLNVAALSAQTATYTTRSSSPFLPFFALRAKPLVLNYTAGMSGIGASSTITMAELNGFSCGGLNCVTVSFIKPAAAGLNIGLSPSQISDPPSNTTTLSVNIAAITPAGIYTIYILGVPGIGANGPSPGTDYLGAITNVTLTVVPSSNFAMASSPGTIITTIGASGTSTISVAGGKIFTGIVSLTTSISPTTGLACTLNPTTVTSTSSPWLKKLLLSCTSTAGGTFTVAVTGTSGSVMQTTTVTFITPSFSLTASPTGLTIRPGLSSTSTISLQSVSGFVGTVILSAAVTPVGAGESLTRTSATLVPGGTNSSVLTINIPPSAAGIYTVTVTGVSGSITQTATVIVSTGAANIVITSVTQTPTSPTAGQTVTFTVVLNNTGVSAGNFSLWINWGSVRVAGPLNDTIPAGQIKTEVLMWDTTGYATASNLIVAVLSTAGGNNGPSSQLSGQSLPLAAAPAPLFNTTIIAAIAAVIAIAAIALAIILVRRRKTAKIV